MGRITGGGLGVVAVVLGLTGLLACSVLTWRSRPFRVLVPGSDEPHRAAAAGPDLLPALPRVLAVPAALMVGVAAGVLTAPPRRQRPGSVARRDRRLSRAGSRRAGTFPDPVRAVGSGRSWPDRWNRHPDVSPPTTRTTCWPSGSSGGTSPAAVELVVDLGGYSHDLSRGRTIPRGRNTAWQQRVLQYLGSGRYALATRFSEGHGYSRSTAAEIESWPVRLQADEYALRQPPR